MKKLFISSIIAASAALTPYDINAEVTISFRAENVMLPSTQWSEAAYEASVWVYNKGENYYDRKMYNHIWGVPDADASGREWFDPAYELTGSEEHQIEWQTVTGPFRSESYYKNRKSFQWTTGDITADIYMRRTFTLDEVPAEPVFMAVGHDDGPAEFYINGVLVFAVTDGWNEDEMIMLDDDQKSLLKGDGAENLIAVHVHQNWGGAFADCGLYRAEMSELTMFLPSREETDAWECEYFHPIDNYDVTMYETEDRWYEPDFEFATDAEAWIQGDGPFANDKNSKFCATYWDSDEYPILIRRRFNVTASQLRKLKLPNTNLMVKCSYDEYPRMFLNGEFIWAGDGWNDNRYDHYMLSDAQKKLLKEGENMICVSVLQGNGGGHIDFGLELAKRYIPGEEDGVEKIVTGMTKASDSRIFDLHGRYVGTDPEALPRGIYIRNGIKLIGGRK